MVQYLYIVLKTKWFLEVTMERLPDWDSNPRPLSFVRMS